MMNSNEVMTKYGTVSMVYLEYAKVWEIIVFTDTKQIEIGRFKDEQKACQVFDVIIQNYNI